MERYIMFYPSNHGLDDIVKMSTDLTGLAQF